MTSLPPKTLVLTDSPQAGDWLLGERSWRQVDPTSLSADDRRLWSTLASDRQALTTDGPTWPGWRRLVVIDRADSSQFDQLQADADRLTRLGPVACLALSGRDFHGLRQRPWQALRGNLHLSAAFALNTPVARLGPGLSMLPAVATVDAVIQASGGAISPGIKWVNDLLIGQDKVAGVLTATRIQGPNMTAAVLGVGLNLEQAPDLAPTPFVPRATCLNNHTAAAPMAPRALLDGLLGAITSRLQTLQTDGPADLLQAYRQHAMMLGRQVQIWEEGSGPPDPPCRGGVVEAIEDDLCLRLEGDPLLVTRGRLALDTTKVED